MLSSFVAGALGVLVYRLFEHSWRHRPGARKGLRFPNGIPRVPLGATEQGTGELLFCRAQRTVCVFSSGQRVEVAGKEVRVSLPLSGGVVDVEDIAGTKLWRVEFQSKDKGEGDGA